MSTHNICLHSEIRKILSGSSLLSGAMVGRPPTMHAHKCLDKVLRPGAWLCTRMTTFNFPFTELSTLTIYLFLLNKSQTKATF